MTISSTDLERAEAVKVAFNWDRMTVTFADGRALSVPVDWYPRLKHSSARERENWQIIGDGTGITWPEIDEDLSVAGLLAGRRSMETNKSFARWMERRSKKNRKSA